MSNDINPQVISFASSASNNSSSEKPGNWFEAMADAWGEALDEQADRIVQQSERVADGFNSPAEITELTAESLRMNFISNSSHTALTSVGSSLDTLARKQ